MRGISREESKYNVEKRIEDAEMEIGEGEKFIRMQKISREQNAREVRNRERNLETTHSKIGNELQT